MKASELTEKMRRYYWLKDIAADYKSKLERLTKEGDAVTVDFVGFTCRSDRTETITLNRHRTISAAPFIKAIEQCLAGVKAEMEALQKEIEKVVELD